MRIAFLTYPAAFQNVGGGEILLLKLAEYIRRKDVIVDLFDIWNGDLKTYDVLHVFGSVKDCLGLVRVANARSVKVAISPLLWSDWRRALHTDGSAREKLDLMARHLAKVLFPAFPSSRRELLLRADLVVPNSEMEKKHIARLFCISEKKMRVVYNGVDAVFQDARPDEFQKRYGSEPFILTVGRIEPRKNQLNLIRAVQGIPGAKLVCIGSPVSGYEGYYERCQKEGKGFTTFLPTLKHEDGMLASAYAACSLFILPAWFETPGMVALEAALAGADVLATQGGSTREYFLDTVLYLDPSSPSGMRSMIQRSLSEPKRNEALKKRVRKTFLWEKIADDYVHCYEELLGTSNRV